MREFYIVSVKNDLGDHIIEKAKKFADLVVSETYDRFDYNYKRRVETIYVGKIAEESFVLFAKKELGIDLDVNYDVYEGVRNVDENDFFVNGYDIDIKSSKDTKNEGIDSCFSYFNFPVPTDQTIKEITVSILYDYNIENFYIVSWIDKEKYEKNAIKKDLPVGFKDGKKILRNFYLYKLQYGHDYRSLIELLSKHK